MTGGASGIAAEIVTAFARQGNRVGFVDMDAGTSAALAAPLPGEVAVETCELTDIDVLWAAVPALKIKMGRAKALVSGHNLWNR